jgi:hypothetical protein
MPVSHIVWSILTILDPGSKVYFHTRVDITWAAAAVHWKHPLQGNQPLRVLSLNHAFPPSFGKQLKQWAPKTDGNWYTRAGSSSEGDDLRCYPESWLPIGLESEFQHRSWSLRGLAIQSFIFLPTQHLDSLNPTTNSSTVCTTQQNQSWIKFSSSLWAFTTKMDY